MARTVAIWAGLLIGIGAMTVTVLPRKPVVGPVVPKPSGVLEGVSPADVAILQGFHAAMADIVVRDGAAKQPVCKTLFDLRARYRNALSMAFENTGMVGRYTGLGQRLDEYLLLAVGDKDLPLTPELRQSAARAFAAIK
jgi:hypothetical protein